MQPHISWSLPAELWSKVLRFTTLEEYINEDDDLLLLHPSSSHRQSLFNKRSVVNVCRKWRKLAIEYLWESVGNINQTQLVELADFLKKDAVRVNLRRLRAGYGDKHSHYSCQLNTTMGNVLGTEDAEYVDNRNDDDDMLLPRGWWIRSLVTRFDFGDDLNTFVSAITAIFPFCPNLVSFIHIHDYNGPLPTSVINALADHCGRTLVRFQLDWGGVNIDDLIHLLDQSSSLQHIALGCTFDPPSSNLLPPEVQENSKREFHFEKLRTLQFGNSEDGMIRRFNSHLLEAATWDVPSLTSVAIDIDARTSIDEVLGFLQVHGGKLKTLSLTDSGRLEGIPITWSEIFTLCPNIKELRTTYNPFSNINIEILSSGLQPSDHQNIENEGIQQDLSVAQTPTGDSPVLELPQLVTSPAATQLQRLCFDKWEFFPGMDCVMQETHHGGPQTSLTSAEDFLASIHAQLTETPLTTTPVDSEEDKQTQERSERLLMAYRRVLDNVFKELGSNKLTPSLQTVQFDFHAGRLDLPDSCTDWWNGWLETWRSKGLQVEGCQRRSLLK